MAWTLAHLSDLHLTTPRWGWPVARSLKRTLAFGAWSCKKRHRHDRDVLDAAARDLKDIDPDATIVTGDLTQLGLPDEYRQAKAWLSRLGDSSTLVVVPGNHDTTCAEPPDRTLDLWSAWTGFGKSRTPPYVGAFPVVRHLGDDGILIGLSSALPSGPLRAVGTIDQRQLELLEGLLEGAQAARRFRVLFAHHPPSDGVVTKRKCLTNAPALRAILRRYGVELFLHGHAHRPSVSWLDGPNGRIPAVGAPSASEVYRDRAAYNVYTIRPSKGAWTIEMGVRTWETRTQVFVWGSRQHLEVSRERSNLSSGMGLV